MLPPLPGATPPAMPGMNPPPPQSSDQPIEGSQAPAQNFPPPEGARTSHLMPGAQPNQPVSHPSVQELQNAAVCTRMRI